MSLIKVTGQEELYAVEIEIGAANYSVWKTKPAAKKPPRNSE